MGEILDEKNYFIKVGYKSRRELIKSLKTRDSYWNNERIFYSNYYQYGVYKLAKEIIKTKNIQNVIDIGCGPGTKLMKLLYPVCKNVTGIDQFEIIEFCKKNHPQGNFISDDIENPKVELGKFDLIICSDVIEHLLDPDFLLLYAKRVAHEDSLILISTPERDKLRSKNSMGSKKEDHIREWNSKELVTYLDDRGFEIIKHKISPFMKFSFNKKVLRHLKAILTKTGTIYTNQIVLCKIKK